MTPFVLLTRPDHRNAELTAHLRQAGLDVLTLPALELSPVLPEPLPNPADYDLLVFVSGFAVGCYFHALKQPWPQGVYAAAVGVASAKALQDSGVVPNEQIVAPSADSAQDSEALWTVLQQQSIHAKRVLIVCGDGGRTWLAEQFEDVGAQVVRYRAYVRKAAIWKTEQMRCLADLVQTKRRAIVLLTSSQGVDAWLLGLQQTNTTALLVRADFVVLHERIAQHLLQKITSLCQGTKPTIIVSKPEDIEMFRSIMTLASS